MGSLYSFINPAAGGSIWHIRPGFAKLDAATALLYAMID